MKPRIVVIGGGGHARVILDILSGQFQVTGFTSLEEEEATTGLLGFPRLGADDILNDLHANGILKAFVALGSNHRRRAATALLQSIGYELVNAISPHVVISRYASLNQGIAIMPGAIINAGTHISDGAIINTNSSVDHDCEIGAFAHIAPGATIAGSVKIGEEVLIGIGARAIPNIRIGDRSIVAAGAVVIEDVPSGVLVAGVPAKVMKEI